MKLLVTYEMHAVEVDGKFYNPKGVLGYSALCNYHFVFKDLLAVLRCKKKAKTEPDWLHVNGEGVSVNPIPDLNFNKPLKTLFSIPRAVREGLKAIKSCDRYMVRLPGPTGALMALLLLLKRKKYAVELAGDPIGMFEVSNELVKHQWFYNLFNGWLYRRLLKRAYCVAYRSEYLRKLYPCGSSKREWVFSGAQLSKEFIGRPRDAKWFRKRPFKLMFVGRIGKEKGVIQLLHAFKELDKRFPKSLELHFIGDGIFLPELKSEASRLGLGHSVCFHGRIPRGPALVSLLDQAYCFVLPTFLEGMPRSLIEAMAYGIPCFASDIPPVAEVLDSDLLFAPKNTEAIVEKIESVVNDPERLANISLRCFEASKGHWPEVLATAKQGFWGDVLNGCK